ncbi:MAG: class I mannose-6-phosphate isomerase [Candidatus Hydrogenedentes bacterium]|nr:class I mannose-6-phosphate isomerase [Candidatus Hydrogenedentota bacterium]
MKMETFLLFDEGYFYRTWGNFAFVEKFHKLAPPNQKIGEAWLISDREEYESKVTEGTYKGKTLNELVRMFPKEIYGENLAKRYKGKRFPLLLKLIDANEILSVQVHPSDEIAKKLGERDGGKTEMWYILEAKMNSFIYLGLQRGVKKEHLLKEIRNQGDVERLLNKIYVKPGDYFLLPAGTIHAIGPGIVLAEIQQNSNITYRLYDWNRIDSDTGKPRVLHLDKAMEAVSEGGKSISVPRLELHREFGLEKFLCSCPFFNVKLFNVEKPANIWERNDSFHIVFAIRNTFLEYDNEEKIVKMGEAILIPALSTREIRVKKGEFLDYYING